MGFWLAALIFGVTSRSGPQCYCHPAFPCPPPATLAHVYHPSGTPNICSRRGFDPQLLCPPPNPLKLGGGKVMPNREQVVFNRQPS